MFGRDAMVQSVSCNSMAKDLVRMLSKFSIPKAGFLHFLLVSCYYIVRIY